MSLTDRLARAQSERVARARGVDPQVLVVPPESEPVTDEPVAAGLGRACPQCGTEGNIDLVDALRSVAYLSCGRCGATWDSVELDTGPRPAEQPRLRG